MTTAPEALRCYVAIRSSQDWNLNAVLEEAGREYLTTMLKCSGNNQCVTAEKLGMHRNTLRRYLDRLGITIEGHVKQREAVNN
jgi:DNA-binding protein Fis